MMIQQFPVTITGQEVSARYDKMVKRGYIEKDKVERIVAEVNKQKSKIVEGQKFITVVV